MIRKKIISAALAMSMAVGLLGRCSSASNTDTNTGTTASTTQAQTEEKPQAMGRYAESSVEFPGESGDRIVDMIQLEDGSLELYIKESSGINRYLLRDGQWEKQEKSLLEELEFPYYFNMTYGEDKNRYVSYHDAEGYKADLVKL